MATWAEFSHQAPDLAEKGRALLYRTGAGEALLATVREDDPPRVHPIAVAVIGSGLYAFMLPSPKLTDLEADGRYAFTPTPTPQSRTSSWSVVASGGWTRPRGRRSHLGGHGRGDAPAFEFLIEAALLAERASRDDWPPKYSTWAVARSATRR